jgi:hypothetical protein
VKTTNEDGRQLGAAFDRAYADSMEKALVRPCTPRERREVVRVERLARDPRNLSALRAYAFSAPLGPISPAHARAAAILIRRGALKAH